MSILYKRLSILLCLLLLLTLSVYGQESSVLDPHGEAAREIANLWLVMLFIAIAVYGQVISLFFMSLFWRRRGGQTSNLNRKVLN